MAQDNDWSEFIPPERAVELAGKWKHGYIPLDAAALSEKMHGRTGGKEWWPGDGKAVGVPKRAPKPSEQHKGMTDQGVRQAYLKAPKGSGEKKAHGAEQERRFNAQAKRDLMTGRDRLNALGIDAHGNKAKSRRVLSTKEVPSAGFKKRPRVDPTKTDYSGMSDKEVRSAYLRAPKGSPEKASLAVEQKRRFDAQAKKDIANGKQRLAKLGIDAHGNKIGSSSGKA